MALSTSRTLITKTGISTTQVFDMGGINIAGGDFNLGSAIKLGNASGIVTATSFSGSFSGSGANLDNVNIAGIITAQSDIHVGAGLSVVGVSTFTETVKFDKISDSISMADSLVHTGNSGTKLQFHVNAVELHTSSTQRLQINSGGNLIFRSPNNNTGEQPASLRWINENNAGDMGKISLIREAVSQAPGALAFYTSPNVDTSANSGRGDITERLRITSAGDLGINNSIPQKKVHISTTGNQKIVIDPNFANNSGGSSNSEANANNIVESILIRTSYGDNAGSQTNAGHKWGIKFQGYNGNDFTQARSKCAGVFAVSEDTSAGYNRNVGLAFHTSQFDTAHREVMRINTNGVVTKPYQPAFIAGRTGGNQTFTIGTFPFNVARLNVGNHYSTSTYKFTAPVAGVYYFFAQVYYNNGSGNYRVGFRKEPVGGSALMLNTAAHAMVGNDNTQCLSIIESLAVGDTVRLFSDQNASIQCYYNINDSTFGAHTYFMGYLIG